MLALLELVEPPSDDEDAGDGGVPKSSLKSRMGKGPARMAKIPLATVTHVVNVLAN